MEEKLPNKKIVLLPIDKLLLDKDNPRFVEFSDLNSQKEIAKVLWQDMNLDELLLSIAVNGYYTQEPLLVIQKDSNYIVIEGNRRLATVKILLDPALAKYVGARFSDIPKPSEKIKESLKSLPVIKFDDRVELWNYLTFRHINGPRSWSSLSKAEYVANLHQEKKIPFDTILKSMGDKSKLTIKMYNALMVLRQGEKLTRFKREDVYLKALSFSHLYTIMQYPNTQEFLGIQKYGSSDVFPENPVPKTKQKELEDLLVWIFGSRTQKQPSLIKSQNPDLRTLDDVLQNRSAVMYLRDNSNLEGAHELTEKEDVRFGDYIIKAETIIRKAKSLDDTYKGDISLKEKMDNIINIAKEIYEKMNKYSQKK